MNSVIVIPSPLLPTSLKPPPSGVPQSIPPCYTGYTAWGFYGLLCFGPFVNKKCCLAYPESQAMWDWVGHCSSFLPILTDSWCIVYHIREIPPLKWRVNVTCKYGLSTQMGDSQFHSSWMHSNGGKPLLPQSDLSLHLQFLQVYKFTRTKICYLLWRAGRSSISYGIFLHTSRLRRWYLFTQSPGHGCWVNGSGCAKREFYGKYSPAKPSLSIW